MLKILLLLFLYRWYYIVVVPVALTSSRKWANPDEMELDEVRVLFVDLIYNLIIYLVIYTCYRYFLSQSSLLQLLESSEGALFRRRRHTGAVRPYITAKLNYLPDTFTLGDEKAYNGFFNRPVPNNQPYLCFVMAELKDNYSVTANEKQVLRLNVVTLCKLHDLQIMSHL